MEKTKPRCACTCVVHARDSGQINFAHTRTHRARCGGGEAHQTTHTHRADQCRDAGGVMVAFTRIVCTSTVDSTRARVFCSSNSSTCRSQRARACLESALYLCTVPKPEKQPARVTSHHQHQQQHLPGRQSENTCPPAYPQLRQQAHVVYAPDAHTTKPLDRRCPSSLPERLSQQKIWI